MPTPPRPAFGRRAPPPAPARAVEPPGLGDRAEAFRAELAAGADPGADAFAAWRRDQAGKRFLAWTCSLALLSPGAICFLAHAPTSVASGVEAAGVGANWWLRRVRRRHLAAIRDWRLEDEAGSRT